MTAPGGRPTQRDAADFALSSILMNLENLTHDLEQVIWTVASTEGLRDALDHFHRAADRLKAASYLHRLEGEEAS